MVSVSKLLFPTCLAYLHPLIKKECYRNLRHFLTFLLFHFPRFTNFQSEKAQYKVRRSVADASASLQELVKIRVGELLQTAWATRDQQTDVPQAIVDSVAGLLASTVGDNVNTLLTPLPLPDDAERRGRHKSDRYKYNSVPGFNVVPKGEGYKSALDLLSKQGVSRSILDTLSFTSS